MHSVRRHSLIVRYWAYQMTVGAVVSFVDAAVSAAPVLVAAVAVACAEKTPWHHWLSKQQLPRM